MAHPLKPNTPAPDFALLDSDGNRISLRGYRGRNLVLAFYPADWTQFCSDELTLFQETLDEFRRYNAEVLGLSCDSHHSHRAWAERLKLSMPLLSDFWPHGEVARQYGLFRDGEGTSDRALVFIDVAGTIREIWVAEDPDIAPGLNLVFDALERLRPTQSAREDLQHV
jgi:peroxiredoxin